MENRKIHGYIYIITNLINGKQYVGQTVQTIEERFKGHFYDSKMVMAKAIKKYGRDNFMVQELAIAYNQEELTFLEGLYISWFNTLRPNGYNIKEIIDGKGKHSKETIEKIKISSNKPENLKRLSENGKKRRGKYIKNSKSKYCGVSTKRNKYVSCISFNNGHINIGYYITEEDAAKAYDLKALELFGHDCILNFPELRQDYIDGKIFIKRCSKQDYSKSKQKGISFIKNRNMWIFLWFDKIKNKNTSKSFKLLEDAIIFKQEILSCKNNEEYKY